MHNRKRPRDISTIDIDMQVYGSSAECSSDEEPSNLRLSDSGAVFCSNDENSSEMSEATIIDDLYADKMSLRDLNAGKDKLQKFLDKSSTNQPVSFVELYQLFDVGTKFNDFITRAKQGRAEITVGDDLPSHRRMAADAFNRSEPKMKAHFLKDVVGEQVEKAGFVMMLTHCSAMSDIMDIRYHIVKKLSDIGDVIAAKNKESYDAAAKMPAYSTVIKARRAEVEAMLDAGNQQEYLAQQRM